VTGPLSGVAGVRVKELPLDMVPVMEVADFTLPVTESVAEPPPLIGVPYAVALPEKEQVPVIFGIATVSPAAGGVVVVWKKTASPEESITPGPDVEAPPLPETSSVQLPITLYGPPVQPTATVCEEEPPQLTSIAHNAAQKSKNADKVRRRDMNSPFAGRVSIPQQSQENTIGVEEVDAPMMGWSPRLISVPHFPAAKTSPLPPRPSAPCASARTHTTRPQTT